MGKFIDMTKQKFGKLFVTGRAANGKRTQARWNCVCDCGGKVTVYGYSLRDGHTKSCGCLSKETTIERSTTHGMCGTATYSTWNCMKTRCENPKTKNYKNYGGRGITVCGRWDKFENFLEDMGEKPEGLSIERVDNNKGYFKENCKWATCTEQSRNRRTRSESKTGIKGVSWDKASGKYVVRISTAHKRFYLGVFSDLEKAKQVRTAGEQKYWGVE